MVIKLTAKKPTNIAWTGLRIIDLGIINNSAVNQGYVLENASPTLPSPIKLMLGGNFPDFNACATDSKRAKWICQSIVILK